MQHPKSHSNRRIQTDAQSRRSSLGDRTLPLARIAIALSALTFVASCGSDSEDPAPDPTSPIAATQPNGSAPEGATNNTIEIVAEPEPPQKAPADLHFSTDLLFVGSPDAPHRLTVTFQGPSLCRWTMLRLKDEDKDRVINYRLGDRIFELPKDSQSSIEYGEKDSAFILLRMELRRAAMFWPDTPRGQPEWTVGEDDVATLQLVNAAGEELGRIEMTPIAAPSKEEATGSDAKPTDELETTKLQLFTAFDVQGTQGEALRILERYEHEGRSWPKRFALEIGPTEIWTETVTKLNTQSWFGEEYFAPFDRAEELAPKKD